MVLGDLVNQQCPPHLIRSRQVYSGTVAQARSLHPIESQVLQLIEVEIKITVLVYPCHWVPAVHQQEQIKDNDDLLKKVGHI